MGILSRFTDIISANVNALLDKAEDPAKMIDQYLRKMTEDLAEVKKETAAVMAEETRVKRMLDENQAEVQKYTDLAKKALTGGNEEDAKVFIEKKQKLETQGANIQKTYNVAHENATKMRQMHDKLTSDIQELNARRDNVKAKVAVANTQETINKYSSYQDKSQGAMSAFDRMEDKADRMLDEANATAELNTAPVDEAENLEEKYSSNAASVDEELNAMKKELGI